MLQQLMPTKPARIFNKKLREVIQKRKDFEKKKKGAEDLTTEEKAYWEKQKESYQTEDKVVVNNVQTFIDVGLAIAKIRDEELHLVVGMSFEKYLVMRLGISRSQGYRYIEGAEFAQKLKNESNIDIVLENHVRQLIPLKDVSKAAKAYREAEAEVVKDPKKKLTARLIKEKAKVIDADAYKSKAPQKKSQGDDSKKDDIKRKLQDAINRNDKQAALSLLAKL